MAGDVKVRLNRQGVRDLLRSREIRGDLVRRAEAIAERAGTEVDEDGMPDHTTSIWTGRNRARATIRTATPRAMVSEATDRTLTRSLDAGRRP